VTIDGVWIDNWIYWITLNYSYSVLHFTADSSRPQHQAGNGPSACVPLHCLLSAESLLFRAQDLLQTHSQSLNSSQLLCPWPPSQVPEPPFSDCLTQLTNSELNSAATGSDWHSSQSHVTTDDQSVSKSWIRAQSGSHDRTLISV
jgi:hypothetical protein